MYIMRFRVGEIAQSDRVFRFSLSLSLSLIGALRSLWTHGGARYDCLTLYSSASLNLILTCVVLLTFAATCTPLCVHLCGSPLIAQCGHLWTCVERPTLQRHPPPEIKQAERQEKTGPQSKPPSHAAQPCRRTLPLASARARCFGWPPRVLRPVVQNYNLER